MSATLDVNLQDHYEILGIDPQAVSETIQRAYATLAQRYRPKNPVTGDAAMFEALNLAYEILSDPQRRRQFDELKGYGKEERSPKFSGVEFFNALGSEAVLRMAILCLLYDRRRTRPSVPGISLRSLEVMVEATAVELSAALWYLKQRGLATSDDQSSLQITADGMDFLVSKRPVPEDVMAMMKPAAIAVAQPRPLQAQPRPAPPMTSPAPKHDAEPALSTLRHALARTSA
jgi:hypothetical protein